MPARRPATLLLALSLLATPVAAELDPAHQWPQWRGPRQDGSAPHGDPPVEWSEKRNVRWKTALPGRGHSSPIVWGGLVFVTTAIPAGEAQEVAHEEPHGAHDNILPDRELRFEVLALDRTDGTIRWRTAVERERPHEGVHATGTWASNSPVTDGRRLFASFGSRGLFALDLAGEVLWQRDLGDMQTRHGHGEGSSPALHGDTLIVNWDHEGDSFLVAFDAATGEQRWKVARDEMTSWSTPLVVTHDERPQVVVSATGKIRGYDLATGESVWECGGLSRNVVASPVAHDGLVIAGNSYDWKVMLAIRLAQARGDVTGSDAAIAWRLERFTPYVPSPLLLDGELFFLAHNQNILTRLDASTGERRHGPARLAGLRNIFASPVGAAGRVYVTDRDGATAVLAPGEALEVVAVNRLDDSFSASAAIAGRDLLLRGEQSLYCLATPEPATPEPAKPATPEPATPEPAKPATPEPATRPAG